MGISAFWPHSPTESSKACRQGARTKGAGASRLDVAQAKGGRVRVRSPSTRRLTPTRAIDLPSIEGGVRDRSARELAPGDNVSVVADVPCEQVSIDDHSPR